MRIIFLREIINDEVRVSSAAENRWSFLVASAGNSYYDSTSDSGPSVPMLPTAGVNQVFGLLDLVRAYNGRTDVAKLNIELRVDIDELLPSIDTAEYFGL